MKKRYRIICVLLVLSLLLSGCSMLKDLLPDGGVLNFDGKTVIDVFAGLEITYGSEHWRDICLDGSGDIMSDGIKLNLDKIDYDKSNADVKDFLKDIDFYWVEEEEMDGKLRNGDTITIALEYSKSDAEALNIRLLEESKEFTVSGLIEVYRDPSEISEDTLWEAYNAAAPLDGLMAEADIDWYLYDDSYHNFTYYTNQRTFFEYWTDGSGEPYIKYFLILMEFHSEFDYYEDGEFKEHNGQHYYQLYIIQLDRSGDPYSFHDEDNSQAIYMGDSDNRWLNDPWDGQIGGHHLAQDGTLTHPEHEDAVIEEFDMG